MLPAPSQVALNRKERILLSAVIGVGLVLRLVDAMVHTYSPDQEYSVGMAQLGWGELIDTIAADTHPPFYYLLLKIWFILTPDTELAAQVLSILFAAATMWVIFRMGRELFSPAAGWVALTCTALAPYQIYWNHAARNHQLQPLATILILWLSYRYLISPGRRLWLGLAGAWLLSIQINYMGFIIGLMWGVAFLLIEAAPFATKLRLAATPLLGLVSSTPWVITLVRQMREGPANHPFFQDVVSPVFLYYHSLFGAMVPYQPNQTGLSYIAFLLVFTLVTVLGFRAVGRRWSFWFLLLVLPWAPIVIAKLAQWTLAERHLAFCVPLFMVYWGASVVEVWRLVRRRLHRDATEA